MRLQQMSDTATNQERAGKERTYWIAIKCPNVGLPTPTGISTSKQGFNTGSFHQNSFSCGVCGQMHTWNGPDAFLVVPRGKYNGEHFENEVLVLDGSSFDGCKLLNSDIYLSRGNFSLVNSEIGNCKFFFSGEAAAVRSIADSLRSQ